MKIKVKRRRYLLIEILLSIGLLSLCLFPLIQPLFLQLKKERELVLKTRMEMIAKNSFIEFKQALYEKNKAIILDATKGLAGTLSTIKYVEEKNERVVERNYTLKVLKTYNKKSPPAQFYLCEVEIQLTTNKKTTSYFYTAFIQEQSGVG